MLTMLTLLTMLTMLIMLTILIMLTLLTMLISQVSGTEFFTAVFEWHDEEELVPAVRGVCLRWSSLITINSSLVFSVPEGNDGDHDDQWR